MILLGSVSRSPLASHQSNIENVYLRGDYMEQPIGFITQGSDLVFKAHQFLYGIKKSHKLGLGNLITLCKFQTKV